MAFIYLIDIEVVCFLSTRLYKERLSQVDIKLQEVMAGCAQEYLEPLANLQENMQIRTKVAGRTNRQTTYENHMVVPRIF